MLFLKKKHHHIADKFRKSFNRKFSVSLTKEEVRSAFYWFDNNKQVYASELDLVQILKAFLCVGEKSSIPENQYKNFALEQASKISKSGLNFDNPLSQNLNNLNDVKGSCFNLQTLVHDFNPSSTRKILLDITLNQFRNGMGGVWFADSFDIKPVLSAVTSDAEKHGYKSRVSLLDFTSMEASDGYADRTGIKAAFEMDYNQLSEELYGSFDDVDELLKSKIFSFLAIFCQEFSHEIKQARPSEIAKLLTVDKIINRAYDSPLQGESSKKLQHFLRDVFRIQGESHTEVILDVALDIEDKEQHMLSVFNPIIDALLNKEQKISSFAKSTVSFRDVLTEDAIILVILPPDNLTQDLAINLYRRAIHGELSSSTAPTDVIGDRRKLSEFEFRPVVCQHQAFSQKAGEAVVMAQSRALSMGTFHFMEYIRNSNNLDEKVSLEANLTNHLVVGNGYLGLGDELINNFLSYNSNKAYAMSYGHYDVKKKKQTEEISPSAFFVGRGVTVKVMDTKGENNV